MLLWSIHILHWVQPHCGQFLNFLLAKNCDKNINIKGWCKSFFHTKLETPNSSPIFKIIPILFFGTQEHLSSLDPKFCPCTFNHFYLYQSISHKLKISDHRQTSFILGCVIEITPSPRITRFPLAWFPLMQILTYVCGSRVIPRQLNGQYSPTNANFS